MPGSMLRILLDANMPIGLRAAFPDHRVLTAFEMGWGELTNGKLLTAAEEAGFSVMITGDKNIVHQQNLATRQLALVVLPTNLWPTIRGNLAAIVIAAEEATPGSYAVLMFERPPLRRRPWPTGQIDP